MKVHLKVLKYLFQQGFAPAFQQGLEVLVALDEALGIHLPMSDPHFGKQKKERQGSHRQPKGLLATISLDALQQGLERLLLLRPL